MKIKTILIAIVLTMTNSLAYASGGFSKVFLGGFEMIRHSLTKRPPSVPRGDLGKRFISTPGYRPAKLITLEFQKDDIPQQKVRFLDRTHERYIRLNQSSKVPKERDTVSTERRDDHTLVVNLKKK